MTPGRFPSNSAESPVDPTSLENLNDISIPSVGWSELAPGLWWSMGIALGGLVLWMLLSYLRFRQRKYRRVAEQHLEQLRLQWKSRGWTEEHGRTLGSLLKQVAIVAAGRSRVASLTGASWFGFLNEREKSAAFSPDQIQLMSLLCYDAQSAGHRDEEIEQLFRACKDWIRNHQQDLYSSLASS